MRTVCWQFCFSDRFTGARNPARLPITIQSRRIRCAPIFAWNDLRSIGLSPRLRYDFILTCPAVNFRATGSSGTKRAVQPSFNRGPVSRNRKFRPSASFWEATRIAFGSLHKNKLRSFLTLLGIILATTTLIAVTALIHGMNVYIADKVSNMGADGFRIVRMAWFGPWDPKKFYEMMKRNPEIKRDEYEFVRSQATLLKDIGMMVSKRTRVSYKGDSMEDVDVEGVTDNIPAINNVQVAFGRGITPEEVAPSRGRDLHRQRHPHRFFQSVDPIGKTIEVEGTPYQVVGVAKELGSVFGNSQDNFVMIPVDSYFKTYGARSGIRLIAKAIDQDAPGGGPGRDAHAAALLPASAAGPGRQFLHLRVGSLCHSLGTAHVDNCGDGGGHRIRVHGSGRHCDHEHHAGGGDRAHARDRHSQIAGRAAARHYEPVPGGIGRALRRAAAWPAW